MTTRPLTRVLTTAGSLSSSLLACGFCARAARRNDNPAVRALRAPSPKCGVRDEHEDRDRILPLTDVQLELLPAPATKNVSTGWAGPCARGRSPGQSRAHHPATSFARGLWEPIPSSEFHRDVLGGELAVEPQRPRRLRSRSGFSFISRGPSRGPPDFRSDVALKKCRELGSQLLYTSAICRPLWVPVMPATRADRRSAPALPQVRVRGRRQFRLGARPMTWCECARRLQRRFAWCDRASRTRP